MILLNFKESVSPNLVNMLEPLAWILTFSFAFLWFRNRITMTALLVVGLYGNLILWKLVLGGEPGISLPFGLLKTLEPAIYLFGLGCITMSQWPQFYPAYLVEPVKWPVQRLIIMVLLGSITLQILGRL